MDIGYIAVIYFIIGIFLAKQCDKLFNYLFGEFNETLEKQKTALRQFVEIIGMFWIIGIVIYAVRNIVELIPSPLDGIGGFKHKLVRELRSASVFTFVFIMFQDHLRDKIKYYYDTF